MKANEMLNEIKTLLNIEVKLEEMKLENGTVISAEAFEKGKEVFIVTDDEKIAMPVGEYILEDGRLVVVEEEGIIADVREVSDEVPAKEEKDGEEITEDLKEEEKMMDEENYVTKDTFREMEDKIQNLEDAIADLKADKVEAEKEEEKMEEVKEELSAVKPIKHNPEASTPQKKQVQFAKGQFTTTLDRVLSKLNK
jgi:vacuolar-type H+-ATPase subunit I/STV1